MDEVYVKLMGVYMKMDDADKMEAITSELDEIISCLNSINETNCTFGAPSFLDDTYIKLTGIKRGIVSLLNDAYED